MIVKIDGSFEALLKTCNNTASTPQLCTVTILWDSYYLREHLRIKHKMKMITYKNKVVNNYNENITGSTQQPMSPQAKFANFCYMQYMHASIMDMTFLC